MEELMKKLQEPFSADDIEWRVQRSMSTAKGNKAIVLAYVTNRAIQKRLDDIFGPYGWRNQFQEWRNEATICGISVYNPETQDWITKWDGADETQVEATKGSFSASQKRAAVQWGIGRYLYNLEEVWVDVKSTGQNYIKTKDFTGYWDTPKLPEWALSNREETKPKKTSNDKKKTTENTTETPSVTVPPDVVNKDTLREKWTKLAGNLIGFDTFYDKHMTAGSSEHDINSFLDAKIVDKQGKAV